MERRISQLAGVLAWAWIALVAFPSQAMAQGVVGQIAALAARVSTVEADVTALSAVNGTQAAQIAALQLENGTQAAQIAALQAGSGTQAAQIVALQVENGTQAAQIAALQAGVVPVGTIIAYSAETPPPGYLECDGTELVRTHYPSLFAVLGTAFGEGDGSSTFHLPDLRGQFLRGWGHGNGFDADRNTRGVLKVGGAFGDHVGSLQINALQGHVHPIVGTLGGWGFAIFAADWLSGPTTFPPSPSLTGRTATQFDAGSDTRPYNVAVMYAIKY